MSIIKRKVTGFLYTKLLYTKKISPVPIMKKFLLNPEQYPDKEAEEFVMALFSVAAILPDTSIPLNLEDLLHLMNGIVMATRICDNI